MKLLKGLFLLAISLVFAMIAGCSFTHGDSDTLSDGYYRNITTQLNNELKLSNRIKENDIEKYPVVYKVEMDKNDKKKINTITVVSGKASADSFMPTFLSGNSYIKFSTIKVAYENNFVSYQAFGLDGKPAIVWEGADTIRLKLDDKGKVEDAFRYVNGDLVGPGIAAQYHYSYNEQGLLAKVAYLDKQGKPVERDKVFGKSFEYDKDGKLTSVSYLNQAGTFAADYNGVAKRTFTYDDKNRLIKVENHTIDGKLANINNRALPFNTIENIRRHINTLMSEGALYTYSSKVEYSYGENGLEKISFGGNSGTPINAINGNIAALNLSFDSQGNLVELKGFGTDGLAKPLNKEGADTLKFTYDKGRVASITWLKGDNPIATSIRGLEKSSIASVHFTYYDNGKTESVSYFDATNQPQKRFIYGQPVHKIVYDLEYDPSNKDSGNKKTYYDVDGKPLTVDQNKMILGSWLEAKGELKVDISENSMTLVNNKLLNAPKKTLNYSIVSNSVTMDGQGVIKVEYSNGNTEDFDFSSPTEFKVSDMIFHKI